MYTQTDLHDCDMGRWPASEGESWTCSECDTTWEGGTVRQLGAPAGWPDLDAAMLDAPAWRTSTGPSPEWDGVSAGCGNVDRMYVSGDWTASAR